jgi:hypothetical protein
MDMPLDGPEGDANEFDPLTQATIPVPRSTEFSQVREGAEGQAVPLILTHLDGNECAGGTACNQPCMPHFDWSPKES